jgi:ParB-like nuclease domain.
MALDMNKIEKSINPLDSMMNEESKKLKTNRVKVVQIKITDIVPNPKNYLSVDDVSDLIMNITVSGFTSSLLVYQMPDGKYKLLSGHRRFKAINEMIKMGSWQSETVSCIVKDLDRVSFGGTDVSEDIKEDYLLIHENDHREYNPNDLLLDVKKREELYTKLKNQGIDKIQVGTDEQDKPIYFNLTGRMRDVISTSLKTVSPATVANVMDINKKGSEVLKEEVSKGNISVGTGKLIANLEKQQQEELVETEKNITDKVVKKFVEKKEIKKIILRKDITIELSQIRKTIEKDSFELSKIDYKKYIKAVEFLKNLFQQ